MASRRDEYADRLAFELIERIEQEEPTLADDEWQPAVLRHIAATLRDHADGIEA